MPCALGSQVHSAFLRAVELQSSDCRRTSSTTERMLGECSANHMTKNHNILFFELWRICVVADFPLDFPVVFTASIIMNRLSYIIESCQTVLFSGLRNISLQMLRIVGRIWNDGSRMLCQWLPSPSTTTRRLVLQNLPSLRLPALIRSPPTRAFPFSLRTTSLRHKEAILVASD